jgi:hypothetical protein
MNRYFTPPDAEIDRVMLELRLDRMQAIRHIQSRTQLREMLAKTPQRYPLGKSMELA